MLAFDESATFALLRGLQLDQELPARALRGDV